MYEHQQGALAMSRTPARIPPAFLDIGCGRRERGRGRRITDSVIAPGAGAARHPAEPSRPAGERGLSREISALFYDAEAPAQRRTLAHSRLFAPALKPPTHIFQPVLADLTRGVLRAANYLGTRHGKAAAA